MESQQVLKRHEEIIKTIDNLKKETTKGLGLEKVSEECY